MATLREQAERLPQSSGIYFFINVKGKCLYIGKAKRLRRRVLQYINGTDERPMINQLLRETTQIDFTLTATEKGALILEAIEIQDRRPKFNIRLLDGAQFLHFSIDRTHPWPMVSLQRFPKKKKGVQYFGPYPDATAARHTLEFINTMFPLRSCSDETLKREKRPCLQYHMHRCLAPCVERCSSEEYQMVLQQAKTFLQGNNTDVLKHSQQRMTFLASELRYEEAAVQRDLIRSIEKTISEQKVSQDNVKNIDYWGMYQVGNQGVFSVLPFRRGQMRSSISIPFSDTIEESANDMLSSLLNGWYQNEIPHEVIVPWEPSSVRILEDVLSERSAHKVRINVPQRGEKVTIQRLATQNAHAQYQQKRSQSEQQRVLLLALQKKLGLRQFPQRIECFDNSNLQGSNPVSAMVVFVNAKAAKREYKRFRIKTAQGADDYAAMYEVLHRRFLRSKKEDSEGWDRPQLLIVDGGRGQVNIACQVLAELSLEGVEVIGISKPRTERRKGDLETPDKIVIPRVKDPLILAANDSVLLFLQRIRDETHNTAVEYQRQVRTKKKLVSSLEKIPGIGAALRNNLILHFGTVSGVKKATVKDLLKVPLVGEHMAKIIYNYFHSSS